MTVEEMEAKLERALKRLKPLEDGADFETQADAYEYAFDIVEDVLRDAIRQLKAKGVR